jgi:hypothetical protein
MSQQTVRGCEELYQRYVNEVRANDGAPVVISATTRRATRGGIATMCSCTCSPMGDERNT